MHPQMHTIGSSNTNKGNDLFIVSLFFILYSYVNIALKMLEENSNKKDALDFMRAVVYFVTI